MVHVYLYNVKPYFQMHQHGLSYVDHGAGVFQDAISHYCNLNLVDREVLGCSKYSRSSTCVASYSVYRIVTSSTLERCCWHLDVDNQRYTSLYRGPPSIIVEYLLSGNQYYSKAMLLAAFQHHISLMTSTDILCPRLYLQHAISSHLGES